MTKALYLENSYLKEFVAEVTGIDEEKKAIILDQSAFYPTGGGQPCDFGTISFDGKVSKVIKVKRENGEILHFIDGELPETGDRLSCELDWERRYKLMRTHSAMHAMSAVAFRDYGAQVTGGNMEPLKGRLDFEFKNFNAELVKEIEAKLNDELSKDLEISSRTLPREEAEKIPDLIRTKVNLLPAFLKEIRVVEISGLDLQADGGTHVASTKEIGVVKIIEYKSKGKINKRIKIAIT